MLIRKENGDLIHVKRENFINDKLYYKKILELKFNISKVEDISQVKTYTSNIIDKYIK